MLDYKFLEEWVRMSVGVVQGGYCVYVFRGSIYSLPPPPKEQDV